jgi:hypothetical protein
MQYAIMKQQTVGSNNIWTAVYETIDGELTAVVYITQQEADAKLTELQAADTLGRSYMIESYQDNPNP